MKTAVVLLSAILLFSQNLFSQASSFIELYDSTGNQKTGRLGWKGNPTDGHFFIEGQSKEISVKNGTLTAEKFVGDGSGLTGLPTQTTTTSVSDVRGLTDSLRLKAPVTHTHSASQITDTIRASQVQYGQFMINSAGEDGQVWKSDGDGRGYWGTDNTSSGTESGGPVAWSDITDKPSTFNPATHTHNKADISDWPTHFKTHWDSISGKPTIGTITGVTGTEGLSGGGTSGNVSLSIASNGVTNAMIAANTIDSTRIANSAVSTNEIANGTIAAVDFNSSIYGGTGSATTVARSDHEHDSRYYRKTQSDSSLGGNYATKWAYETPISNTIPSPFLTVTIEAPSSGFAMVWATANCATPDNNTYFALKGTIGTSSTEDGLYWFIHWGTDKLMPKVFSMNRMFPVSEGTNTFYLNFWRDETCPTCGVPYVHGASMTALFVKTQL